MSAKVIVQKFAHDGSIYKLHTISKILLLGVLGLIFFLNAPWKICIFAIFILALCFWSYTEFLKQPFKFLFIIAVFAGSLLYNKGTGQQLEIIILSGVRLASVIILGFLAGNVLSDREFRILAGKRFAPSLIGALVGIQRIGDIYQSVGDAQQVRGIRPSWSGHKLYMFFLSKANAWLVNILRLNETVHYQFVLRGYDRFQSGLLLRKELSLADFIALLLALALFTIAVFPFSL